MKKCLKQLLLPFLLFTSVVFAKPFETKDALLEEASLLGLRNNIIKTSKFALFSLQTNLEQCQDNTLFVYIEGDGKAWERMDKISQDPTPINAVSLSLMKSVGHKCSLYLARPCQYTDRSCENKDLSSHRYSYTILQNYDEILTQCKQRYKVSDFVVVGYSGGGVIAALLAGNRKDIKAFITVAANLDTDAWTIHHKISPLYGSLNPALFAYRIEDIPQYHLIGSKDTIVPLSIFESFQNRFQDKSNLHSFVYENGHFNSWDAIYRLFFDEIFTTSL